MRFPFPEHVAMNRVALFVVALFVIQRLEGTALYFSVGCAVFLLVAAIAFNTAGGLARASGAYIFSYSVLVVVIGICYKAFLGEPAQSNLLVPQTDILTYVGGITGMFAAALVSRYISRRSGLLQHLLKEEQMYRSSVGCILVGALGAFVIALMGESAVRIQSAFAQLNQLIPLGMIIGVMYEIRQSGGTRSVNLPILLGGTYFFFLGLTGFSKQGMLTPPLCWFLPVCVLRYRVSVAQVFWGVGFLFVFFHYLVPFSQYGRGQVPEYATLDQRIVVARSLLEHPEKTRELYLENVAAAIDPGTVLAGQYYNTPQGFWDRLQFISTDDPLIEFTDQGRQVGFAPIIESFTNTIPRVVWPNKPAPRFGGNYYAHEMGGLSEDDTTTGISFSPTAEAYHIDGWIGIFIVAPLLWFLFFVVFDSLFGDLRATPWGLLALSQIAHFAPEGGLSGLIHLLTYGAEIFIFCALFATWVAPAIASLIIAPSRNGGSPPRWHLRRLYGSNQPVGGKV